MDQTWFNGTRIGATGGFPDSYEPNWLASRAYLIPAHLIHWDDDNVFAIRVYDGAGQGGMYEGVCRLAIAGWADFVHMAFDVGRGKGLFSTTGILPGA